MFRNTQETNTITNPITVAVTAFLACENRAGPPFAPPANTSASLKWDIINNNPLITNIKAATIGAKQVKTKFIILVMTTKMWQNRHGFPAPPQGIMGPVQTAAKTWFAEKRRIKTKKIVGSIFLIALNQFRAPGRSRTLTIGFEGLCSIH